MLELIVTGIQDPETLLFVSSHLAANRGMGEIYQLDLETLSIQSMNTGPANRITFGNNKQVLLGRNCRDAARWKDIKVELLESSILISRVMEILVKF